MENFKSYLTKIVSAYRNKQLKQPLKLCLGNTSADMDSVVGVMVLSYYYYLRHNEEFLPIINSKQSYFQLNFEQVLHFKNHGISENDQALFIEELQPISNLDISEVCLVDHNKLDSDLAPHLEKKVTRIVDHHVDQEQYKDTLKEKQIELIGSACTLVIDKFIKEFPSYIDEKFATFIASPIVLDSNYFEPSLKEVKWTEKDQEVHTYLNKIGNCGKEYWQELSNSKFDFDLNLKIGLKNMLIKDFKIYQFIPGHSKGIGVSALQIPMELIHKNYKIKEIFEHLDNLMQDKDLGMAGIVTNYPTKDGFQKEVLFYCNPKIMTEKENKFEDLIQYLDKDEGYSLKNREQYHEEGKICVQWQIGNTAYSRKYLEKVMKQFYEQKQ